eukprot:4639833-Amphidinium_carterae.1
MQPAKINETVKYHRLTHLEMVGVVSLFHQTKLWTPSAAHRDLLVAWCFMAVEVVSDSLATN